MKRVYLDHGATTVVDKRVLEEMLPYFTEDFGNASSLHSFGQKAQDALSRSRKAVADMIGSTPDEIVFNSGGSEGDNHAIKGVAYHNLHTRAREHGKGKRFHIITTAIEHPAVSRTCEYLENTGFDITYLPVDDKGLIDLAELEGAIRSETILISIMFANNEIGTIQDIKAIGEITIKHDVVFHTDAVQALGKVPIDVNELNIDLMSMSSHKLHGPKGVGALYIRKGTKIEPLIHGGGHEGGQRSSTENIAGIVGFAKACEIAGDGMSEEIKRMSAQRDRIIEGILGRIPDSFLNGHPQHRLPNNVNVGIRYVEGESMLLHLDMMGIGVSTGSACSSKSLKASHVLTAIGVKPEDAHGSLRITLGRFTTDEEIDYLLENLPKIVEKLRALSPLGRV